MKSVLIICITVVCVFNVQANSQANSIVQSNLACDSQLAGGDAWPWFIAKPFPWDNIQGFWKLGDDAGSYLSAKVLSSTNSRKILSLAVFADGVCSKPYAKGTGYVDITEKNVVRALVSDGVFKYQLKLGMFDSRDIIGFNNCSPDIMAVSIQVIARVKKANGSNSLPIVPGVSEIRNMVLKKSTLDVDNACKLVN